jgi:hypothetical protein
MLKARIVKWVDPDPTVNQAPHTRLVAADGAMLYDHSPITTDPKQAVLSLIGLAFCAYGFKPEEVQIDDELRALLPAGPAETPGDYFNELRAVEEKHKLLILCYTKADVDGMEGPSGQFNLTDEEWATLRRRFEKCSEHICEQIWGTLSDLANDALKERKGETR